MTITDLAVRRDTAVDVPLTDQPERVTVTLTNPHRAQVLIAGLTTMAVSGALPLAMAQHSEHVEYAGGALGVAILWTVFSQLRHDAWEKRPPEVAFRDAERGRS